MPGLISSSSSAGPRAAPKAAARRRLQAQPPSSKPATNVFSANASVPPSSPGPTQIQRVQAHTEDRRASPADRIVSVHSSALTGSCPASAETEFNPKIVHSRSESRQSISKQAVHSRSESRQSISKQAERTPTLPCEPEHARMHIPVQTEQEATLDESAQPVAQSIRLGRETTGDANETSSSDVTEDSPNTPIIPRSAVAIVASPAESNTSRINLAESANKRARPTFPADHEAPPVKKARRSTTRSNSQLQGATAAQSAYLTPNSAPCMDATAASNVVACQGQGLNGSDEITQSTRPKTKKSTRGGKVPATDNSTDELSQLVITDDNATAQAPSAKRPRSPKKRKSSGRARKTVSAATLASDEDALQSGETAICTAEFTGNADNATKLRRTPKRRTRRKRRIEAQDADRGTLGEEDPELHEIDPTSLSMWSLSHDKVNGKISELGKKMAEIDWGEVKRKRHLEEQGVIVNPEMPPGVEVYESVEGREESIGEANRGEQSSQKSDATRKRKATPSPHRDIDAGNFELQMDADGNIIVNDDALIRVQNAEAEAAANSDMPVTEDNPITSTFNRTTFLNAHRRDPSDRVPMWRGKSDPWTEEETERFYEALRMFGTDFYIISKMFPPKTRKMIKAKFTREERFDPARINAALMGLDNRPMDLEHYARETGRDVSAFKKYASIEEATVAIRQELEPTQADMTAAIEQEAAEAEREAQEKIKHGERNRAGKRSRKARKEVGFGMGGGGPPDDADG